MTLTLEATYENGQLKFKQPVRLAEGTAVRVTITPISADDDPLADFVGSLDTGRTDGAERHDKYLSTSWTPGPGSHWPTGPTSINVRPRSNTANT